MKKLKYILIFFISLSSLYSCAQEQWLGQKTNTVRVLGSLKVDTALYLPDTTKRPTVAGAIGYKNAPYYWNGTLWFPFGSSVDTIWNSSDSLYYRKQGTTYFVRTITGISNINVPTGLSSGVVGTTATISTTLNGIIRGTGSGFTTTVISSPLDLTGGTLSILQASGSQGGYISSTDWTTFNNKLSSSRAVNTTKSLTGGGVLTSDLTLQLVNDQTAPGNSYHYGTNAVGTKGWYQDHLYQGPLTYNSGTNTVSIPQASASADGFLDSTDWVTFNSKEPSIEAPYITRRYWTGYKTWGYLSLDSIAEGTTNLFFTDARARAALSATSPLTYNSTSGVFGIQQSTTSQAGYLGASDFTNFNTAYNKRITSISFAGDGTKTLTLNQGDGSTLTASFVDNTGAGGTGITDLNGATGSTQSFATGTSGSDFNISTASNIHTFNIPTASASNRGLLSTTDWSTFNNKEDAISAGTTSQYWRGDKTWRDFNTDARGAVSLTTTGSSGSATYNSSTGVLNIPTPPSYTFNNGITNTSSTIQLGGTLVQNTTISGSDFYTAISGGRFETAKGANVATANDLTLGNDGNTFNITGTTQINAITTTNWQAGSTINLIFASTPTVKHNTSGGAGTAPILLAGSADFTAAANDLLTLVYDGASWHETTRKLAATGGAGITAITADNGITANTTSNVRLGGTLLQSTTINTGGFTTHFTGANNATYILRATNTGTGAAGGIEGVSTNGVGVSGTSTSNYGGSFASTSTYALNASSPLGAAYLRRPNTTGTSAVSNILSVESTLTGFTVANGFGGSIDYFLEDAGGTAQNSTSIISRWTVAAAGTRTSRTEIWNTNAGAAVAVNFTISGEGFMKLQPITAAAASAITAADGMIVIVSNTNGTFTSIGFWGYQNGSWQKM
jgi:hypothetical protein